MQSAEYSSIYDAASEVVILRSSNKEQARRYVDFIGTRIKNRLQQGDSSIVTHFDGGIDSQKIGITFDVATEVLNELQHQGILTAAVRVHCPNVSHQSGDDVVVEAETEDELHAAIENSCQHCGLTHKQLREESIELFYVPKLSPKQDGLEDSIPFHTALVQRETWMQGLRSLQSFFGGIGHWLRRDRSAVEQAVIVLEGNKDKGPPETPHGAALAFLMMSGILIVICVGSCWLSTRLLSGIVCFVVVAGLLLLTGISITFASRVLMTKTLASRLLSAAFVLTVGGVLTNSAIGFEFGRTDSGDIIFNVESKDFPAAVLVFATVIFGLFVFGLTRLREQPAEAR